MFGDWGYEDSQHCYITLSRGSERERLAVCSVSLCCLAVTLLKAVKRLFKGDLFKYCYSYAVDKRVPNDSSWWQIFMWHCTNSIAVQFKSNYILG